MHVAKIEWIFHKLEAKDDWIILSLCFLHMIFNSAYDTQNKKQPKPQMSGAIRIVVASYTSAVMDSHYQNKT